MELEHKFINLEFECAKYTKTIKKSQETCIVCMVDEDFEKEIWDRYELQCGHQMHTRCFRKWCEHKGKVNCPYCGDVQDIANNHYCSICNEFGHSHYFLACPQLQEIDDCFADLENE